MVGANLAEVDSEARAIRALLTEVTTVMRQDMIRKWTGVGSSWALAAALGLAGCSGGGELGEAAGVSDADLEETSEEVHLEPFAVFESEKYGTVKFLEPEPGELSMAAMTPFGADPEGRLGAVSPADIYEELSGEELPERFRAAVQAAESNSGARASSSLEGDTDVGAGTDAPGLRPLGITQVDLSTEEYISRHCPNSEGWCWTNRTNTSYMQRHTAYMRTYAYSYRGSITHRLRRKNTFGTWVTHYSATVPEGYLSTFASLPVFAYMTESKVYDASENGYHHSGWF
jgi:hypothetical protein